MDQRSSLKYGGWSWLSRCVRRFKISEQIKLCQGLRAGYNEVNPDHWTCIVDITIDVSYKGSFSYIT